MEEVVAKGGGEGEGGRGGCEDGRVPKGALVFVSKMGECDEKSTGFTYIQLMSAIFVKITGF